MSSVAPPAEMASPRSEAAIFPIPRVAIKGKFFYRGEEKLYLRGVTYGTFTPDSQGDQYGSEETVDADFARMAGAGINCVRVYTVPPLWLLDLAARHQLLVMVGLPWEQHVAFLDLPGRAAEIEKRVRDGVRACRRHPALLGFAVGNEIPSSVVRWLGRKRVEGFIRQLYRAVKQEDPEALVTYVNFPTTEYLCLPFLDFFAFNVYLEVRDRLEAYLARLQNLAGERPLLMAEVGLDSRRNGEDCQAETLAWQIEAIFASGCAGVFVFAWTDEWHRGGFEIEDWDFGLTDRHRQPKPALEAVSAAFARLPLFEPSRWPRISVVICSYNGSRTIGETLSHVFQLEYPDYEVIVVDDGSRDDTARIARQFPVRLISVPNGGLSQARNLGAWAAEGEIVAYVDDDAYPDTHWLRYLAHAFLTTDVAGVGGPNIPPAGDGRIAEAVANSPGGPLHVLTSDTEAEHIPGCNMAFRIENLKQVGGFDPQFRAAGDDVDFCWRILERGWKIGFHPAAVVWHHRRNSLKAYFRQQVGYGRAEALLERKWPGKYNGLGHVSWAGRIYAGTVAEAMMRRRGHVYQGTWGMAPFQSLYAPPMGLLQQLPQAPEWHLVSASLLLIAMLGAVWQPLLLMTIPFLAAVIVPFWYAMLGAARTLSLAEGRPSRSRWGLFWITFALYASQPFARLWGRWKHGLTPWRRRGLAVFALPHPRRFWQWSETWNSAEQYLQRLEADLAKQGAVQLRGGDFDNWDLEVRGGILGAARLLMAIEEHGGGKQLIRYRTNARWSVTGLAVAGLFAAVALIASSQAEWLVTAILAFACLLLLFWHLHDVARAKGAFRQAIESTGGEAG